MGGLIENQSILLIVWNQKQCSGQVHTPIKHTHNTVVSQWKKERLAFKPVWKTPKWYHLGSPDGEQRLCFSPILVRSFWGLPPHWASNGVTNIPSGFLQFPHFLLWFTFSCITVPAMSAIKTSRLQWEQHLCTQSPTTLRAIALCCLAAAPLRAAATAPLLSQEPLSRSFMTNRQQALKWTSSNSHLPPHVNNVKRILYFLPWIMRLAGSFECERKARSAAGAGVNDITIQIRQRLWL